MFLVKVILKSKIMFILIQLNKLILPGEKRKTLEYVCLCVACYTVVVVLDKYIECA